MRFLRTTGLALAAAATVLWALMLVAVLTADPADGANIGAGMAGLLAIVLSSAASVTLLVAVADGRSRTTPPGRHRKIPWTAAGLAVLSLVAWPVMFAGSYALPERVLTVLLVGAVAAMIVSSLLLFRAGSDSGRTPRSR